MRESTSGPGAGARFGARTGGRRGRGKPKSWLPQPPADHPDGEPVELTAEQRTKLRERAMNLCLWHLGQSPKTRKELLGKMARREIPSDIIEATLDRLEELHLLDDKDYAEQFVRSRHEHRKQGARAIRSELQRKGIAPDLAAEALEAIAPEDEQVNARALVNKKLASTRGLDRAKRVNRLAGMLVRKGYSPGVAFGVVREALEAEGDIDGEDYTAL